MHFIFLVRKLKRIGTRLKHIRMKSGDVIFLRENSLYLFYIHSSSLMVFGFPVFPL